MNNRIFLTIIIISPLLFLSSVSAQMGFRGGVGISDIAFSVEGQTPYLSYEANTLEHRNPMLSYQVGVFGTLNLETRFDFQSELLYVKQGLDYTTKFLYGEVPYKININCLNLPLLMRYNIAVNEKRKSGLYAGPYLTWMFRAVKVTEVDGVREKTEMSNVKDVDFGLSGGYSIDFNTSSGQIVVDLRCSYGLINMMDEIEGSIPNYNGPSKAYARNVNISLTAGYCFMNLLSKNTKKP
jgi:hypothetical protein